MTMSEYEKRFQSPPPSLHQILTSARGPKRGRWRSRCFWVAAVLVGVMTMIYELASHETVHSGMEWLASTEIQHPRIR
jgi:hypothetical protein